MFKKAERSQVKLKIALTGVSGAGKTFSALRLASGLGEKIAVIDSENGSASLYADKFNFDVVTIEAPFSIEKFIAAIEQAEKLKYDVLIIDSISQVWAGEGGLLAEKEKLDARAGSNSFTNWALISKRHEAFKSAILNSPLHIICTMRSKTDYAIVVNEKGKTEPKKMGLAPIQRDGLEYDFSIVFDIDISHNALASKDRTGLFVTEIPFLITEAVGKKIIDWLNSVDLKNTNKEEKVETSTATTASTAMTASTAVETSTAMTASSANEVTTAIETKTEEQTASQLKTQTDQVVLNNYVRYCTLCGAQMKFFRRSQMWCCPNKKSSEDKHQIISFAKTQQQVQQTQTSAVIQ